MRKLLPCILSLALPMALGAAEPATPPAAPGAGTGALVGRVLATDGRTPIEGAMVRACFLEGGASFASPPTNAKGEFVIEGLPSGYADVTIQTADGVFVASQVLHFVPAGRRTTSLVLTRSEAEAPAWWSERNRQQAPCSTEKPTGFAQVQEHSTGFFRSRKGIVILAGAAGAALLLASSGGDEQTASPSRP